MNMEIKHNNVVPETLHKDITFSIFKEFLVGKLPTGGDVIERPLHQKNWTKQAACEIAHLLITGYDVM